MQDPHQSLENLAAPATQQFIAQEHAATLARFCQSPEYAALRDDILARLQDERQIPFCQEHRARMYHFHQSPEFPKGVYPAIARGCPNGKRCFPLPILTKSWATMCI